MPIYSIKTVSINMRISRFFIVLLALVCCVQEAMADEFPLVASATISGTLPVLYINTENGKPVTSKTEYLLHSIGLYPWEMRK